MDAQRTLAADWDPARIGADGLPARLRGAEAARFETDRDRIRACAALKR